MIDFSTINKYTGELDDSFEFIVRQYQKDHPNKVGLDKLTSYIINQIPASTLSGETDPVFLVSDAAGITSSDITNWDAACSWGDHSTAGYLTSLSETDPVWLADKPNYLTSASAAATYSALGHTHTFSSLTSKPTTLSGYGITDAYPLSGNPSGFLTSFSETDPAFTTWLAGPPDISEFNNDTGFITSSALSSYVPTSRTLTINGTAQDLSTDRTWTVGDVLTSGSYADPTWITSLAYSKIVSIAVASSDVTDNNTNTLKDFTDLVLPVVAGNTYYIYAFGHYNSSSTAVGSRWTINGPAVTFLSYRSSYSLSTVNYSINQGLSSYQLPASFNSTSAATTGNTFELKGLIKPSANGNLQVQFACETSLGSITAKAGSFLQLIQIA